MSENGREQIIQLEYPIQPRPRYGYGHPLHQELWTFLNRFRRDFRNNLKLFLSFDSRFRQIPQLPVPNSDLPYWQNDSFYGLDALALYSFLGTHKPRAYVEVGSGMSTLFARRAIHDLSLTTEISSIDPQPRIDVEKICDRAYRTPLEEISMDFFDSLEPDDFLFLDGSHYCFTNSDATVFFLDILPRLHSGVVVHIHDIFLPSDYPPEWNRRFYAEQYLLATYLLGGGKRVRPLLANSFASQDDELASIVGVLLSDLGFHGWRKTGSSFWFRVATEIESIGKEGQ